MNHETSKEMFEVEVNVIVSGPKCVQGFHLISFMFLFILAFRVPSHLFYTAVCKPIAHTSYLPSSSCMNLGSSR
jgi:hypothetical protein